MRIHPAALNMAFATIEPRPQKSQARCRCWLVLAIIIGFAAYCLLMGTLAHIYRP
jgi:hypothetical protein